MYCRERRGSDGLDAMEPAGREEGAGGEGGQEVAYGDAACLGTGAGGD